MKILVRVLLVIFLLGSSGQLASAQCAMCSATAEHSVQHGNTQGKSLNTGILYLLATPYLAIAIVGLVWYKKYRRKNVALNIKDEKISLN